MYGYCAHRKLSFAVALAACCSLLVLFTQTVTAQPLPAAAHPRHEVKTWISQYQGRTFHVTQLPRCEHVETVITHEPSGETRDRAKQRIGGVATLTGSFHHPRSMAIADFLQRNGTIVSGATTGRWFLVILEDGSIDITGDYSTYKGKPGVSAMALGQRLVPLHQDGFSKAFMNRTTERMALGLTKDSLYLVTATTNIWRLSAFMQNKLEVSIAINSDGGHVVRGRAPVHLVFRWRQVTQPSEITLPTEVQQVAPNTADQPATGQTVYMSTPNQSSTLPDRGLTVGLLFPDRMQSVQYPISSPSPAKGNDLFAEEIAAANITSDRRGGAKDAL